MRRAIDFGSTAQILLQLLGYLSLVISFGGWILSPLTKRVHKITLAASSDRILPEQTVIFSGQATNLLGQPAKDRLLWIFDQGNEIGTATTDSQGWYSYPYTAMQFRPLLIGHKIFVSDNREGR